MSNFSFNCPNCNQPLEVPGDMLGQTIGCPACNQKIILPKPQMQSPLAQPVRPVFGVPGNMNRPVQTSAGAIWSLVLGILSFTCFGPLSGIPAIICGHVALSAIARSMGALAGRGMAIAGLVMGYINLALMLLVIPIALTSSIAIPSFMRARTTAQANACINNLRQIEAAKDQYALEAGLSNLATVTWADIGPNNNAEGGYLKQWPRCPASSDMESEPSQAATESDYEINPVGVNAVCKHLQDATPAHRLQ